MAQPNDTTCKPTCLHPIYRYYRKDITLDQVVGKVKNLKEGGSPASFRPVQRPPAAP